MVRGKPLDDVSLGLPPSGRAWPRAVRGAFGWLDRSAAGWAGLAVAAGFALFYAAVVWAALRPAVDEAHRRTFMTGEFGVYPAAAVFGPDGGLAYAPGERVALALPAGRRHLARFDWLREPGQAPTLKGAAGRLFLSVPPRERRGDLPHRLTLRFACALPPGESAALAVRVNGAAAGVVDCGFGRAVFTATLPAGRLGVLDVDEITVGRLGLTAWERALLRLGVGARAVALETLAVTPLRGPPQRRAALVR
jgi:hypothetical protein